MKIHTIRCKWQEMAGLAEQQKWVKTETENNYKGPGQDGGGREDLSHSDELNGTFLVAPLCLATLPTPLNINCK